MSEREDIDCAICGADMEWVSCHYCHGEGFFDLADEDPLYCQVPPFVALETETCQECRGTGGYLECSELPHREAPRHWRRQRGRQWGWQTGDGRQHE